MGATKKYANFLGIRKFFEKLFWKMSDLLQRLTDWNLGGHYLTESLKNKMICWSEGVWNVGEHLRNSKLFSVKIKKFQIEISWTFWYIGGFILESRFFKDVILPIFGKKIIPNLLLAKKTLIFPTSGLKFWLINRSLNLKVCKQTNSFCRKIELYRHIISMYSHENIWVFEINDFQLYYCHMVLRFLIVTILGCSWKFWF